MTVTTVQLLGAIAELIRQGGLLALVVIEGWIIWQLWKSRDGLYDRLIRATETNAQAANQMTERVVTALTRSTSVAERIERRKYGLLPSSTDEIVEDEEDDELEDPDEVQD